MLWCIEGPDSLSSPAFTLILIPSWNSDTAPPQFRHVFCYWKVIGPMAVFLFCFHLPTSPYLPVYRAVACLGFLTSYSINELAWPSYSATSGIPKHQNKMSSNFLKRTVPLPVQTILHCYYLLSPYIWPFWFVQSYALGYSQASALSRPNGNFVRSP